MYLNVLSLHVCTVYMIHYSISFMLQLAFLGYTSLNVALTIGKDLILGSPCPVAMIDVARRAMTSHGGFDSHGGTTNSWMVFVRENPI